MRYYWALILFSPLALYGIHYFFLASPAAPPPQPMPALAVRQLRILIGILTLPEKYEDRHFLRLVYAVQPPLPPGFTVDVRFVFCRLNNAEKKLMLALEILNFGDVIILNCTENMDSGKTHTFFSSLPSILPSPYDYVFKTDDDSYVRVAALAATLQPLSRRDLYFGFSVPCANMNPYAVHMAGMGYAISWDLVEWIAGSDIPLKDLVGPEDKMVGIWFDKGKKAKHRHTAKPRLYDYPGDKHGCPGEFVLDTIVVHRLKTRERWMTVLRYFNVTARLKPSKLYAMD